MSTRRLPPWSPLLLVLGAAVATHSVVRYQLWIVMVYTVLALGLTALVLRRRSGGSPLEGRGGALALAGAGLGTALVSAYSYLQPGDRLLVRWLLALTAVAAGICLTLPRRRAADVGLAVALAGYLVAAVLLIHLDPAPRIDVWVTLQQAADGLAHGENFYSLQWHDSPGVQDAFTYLPWTAVLLAPGRWLAGDVRWALVLVAVIGSLAVWALAGRDAPPRARTAAASAAALLLLLPGTATQVEQAWTEPLLLTCLAVWTLAVVRGRLLLAVLALAVGLACKQHLALLLPVLAAWPGFGPRRTLAAALGAGVLVLPWFLTAPADMWHDVVSVLVSFQPLVFADTLYIAAINELSWTPPFWITGALVLGVLAAATVTVHRRRPGLDSVLRWFALVLFVANLVNKQAFYNQFWLVAALVVLSWAVPSGAGVRSGEEPLQPQGEVVPAPLTGDPLPAGAAEGVGEVTVEQ